MNPYTVEVKGKVLTVRFAGIAAGWEQWILLRSDAHHDSTLCNRTLELAHLNEAKRREALIFDGGDCFDAMQGTHDKRRNLNEVRPEDKVKNYYDSIVDHAAADYAPYAPNWVMLAKGNHETGVETHANHCLSTSLADKLNTVGGGVRVGAFAGWVRFMFCFANTRKSSSCHLRYYHGGGAYAPVTKGVIAQHRQVEWLPDADIIWNGHTHTTYLMPIARERLNDAGQIFNDKVYLVRTPGYKGQGEWEVERGFAPEPQGSSWLRFGWGEGTTAKQGRVTLDASLALG